MPKALFGYLAGPDDSSLAVLTACKARVRVLEAQLEAARAERDALAAALDSALAADGPARPGDAAPRPPLTEAAVGRASP